jgi:membrane glycosyltransferase
LEKKVDTELLSLHNQRKMFVQELSQRMAASTMPESSPIQIKQEITENNLEQLTNGNGLNKEVTKQLTEKNTGIFLSIKILCFYLQKLFIFIHNMNDVFPKSGTFIVF